MISETEKNSSEALEVSRDTLREVKKLNKRMAGLAEQQGQMISLLRAIAGIKEPEKSTETGTEGVGNKTASGESQDKAA